MGSSRSRAIEAERRTNLHCDVVADGKQSSVTTTRLALVQHAQEVAQAVDLHAVESAYEGASN